MKAATSQSFLASLLTLHYHTSKTACSFSIRSARTNRRNFQGAMTGENIDNFVEISKEEARDATNPESTTHYRPSWDKEEDPSRESIGGSFLLFSFLSFLQSGNIVFSCIVGFAAAALSGTKGISGDFFRFIGGSVWEFGCLIIKPINAASRSRAVTLIENRTPKNTSPIFTETSELNNHGEIWNLEELRKQIYCCFDHFGEELSTLETARMKSSSRWKSELNFLGDDLNEMRNELQ